MYVHTISLSDFDSTPWLKQDLFCLVQSLTTALQQRRWKKTRCDDIVSGSQFKYSGEEPIEASLVEPEGDNWTATVEGNYKVRIYVTTVWCQLLYM